MSVQCFCVHIFGTTKIICFTEADEKSREAKQLELATFIEDLENKYQEAEEQVLRLWHVCVDSTIEAQIIYAIEICAC